jgi:Rps23 Pro-64 3,4-dihydroxylase Tpa1-like proline 4-hydroxylase
MIEIENFISDEECKELINYYNKNINNTFYYETNNTYPLHLKNVDLKIIKDILIKIKNECFYKLISEKKEDKILLDNLEIVKWPIGSFMKEHYDTGDTLGFFIYLNDDYIGGETEIINKIKVIPKKGKLFIFNNGMLLHKVNEVFNKERFTLAGWYK